MKNNRIHMRATHFLGILGLVSVGSCTTLAPSSGEYDDLYGNSSSVVVINKNYYAAPKSAITQEPEYRSDYDRAPATSQQVEPTEEYFSEDYVASNALRRPLSADPGYSMDYADGYREGWNDHAWSAPFAWNSPLNQFNYNPWGWDMFGFNRFSRFGWNNVGWGGFGLSPWNTGFDPFWGGVAFGFNSWGWSTWNSPWGWNSFNSPWGWNSWNTGFGWNSFGMYHPGWNLGFNNGFGWGRWNTPVVVTNIYNGGDRTRIIDRSYGPRGGGRGTDLVNPVYNQNNSRNARVASTNGVPTRGAVNTNDRAYAANQRSASSIGGTRASGSYTNAGTSRASATNDYNSYGSSRPTRAAASDAYYRSSREGGESFNSNRNTSSYDRSTAYDRSSRSASGTSFSRSTATPSRSYSAPSSSGGSYSRMGNSSSMGSSSRASSSYSSPSSSSMNRGGYSSSSSSSYSGGGSRGGGGGSVSSGGGGSRGPR